MTKFGVKLYYFDKSLVFFEHKDVCVRQHEK